MKSFEELYDEYFRNDARNPFIDVNGEDVRVVLDQYNEEYDYKLISDLVKTINYENEYLKSEILIDEYRELEDDINNIIAECCGDHLSGTDIGRILVKLAYYYMIDD